MNQTYKATLSQYALPQFLPTYSWGCLNFTLRYSCFPLRSKWGGKGGVIWGDLEVCSLKTMMFEKYPSISPYTYCANNPVRGWKTAVIRCFTWKYSIKKMLT